MHNSIVLITTLASLKLDRPTCKQTEETAVLAQLLPPVQPCLKLGLSKETMVGW